MNEALAVIVVLLNILRRGVEHNTVLVELLDAIFDQINVIRKQIDINERNREIPQPSQNTQRLQLELMLVDDITARVAVIQVIREYTGCDPAEAKRLIDKMAENKHNWVGVPYVEYTVEQAIALHNALSNTDSAACIGVRLNFEV